jgi:hypothetical protein
LLNNKAKPAFALPDRDGVPGFRSCPPREAPLRHRQRFMECLRVDPFGAPALPALGRPRTAHQIGASVVSFGDDTIVDARGPSRRPRRSARDLLVRVQGCAYGVRVGVSCGAPVVQKRTRCRRSFGVRAPHMRDLHERGSQHVLVAQQPSRMRGVRRLRETAAFALAVPVLSSRDPVQDHLERLRVRATSQQSRVPDEFVATRAIMMPVRTDVRHEPYADSAYPENKMGAPFVSLNVGHSDICAVVTVEVDLIGGTT